MLVIGERINASRKSIKEAIEKGDGNHIRGEAVAQFEAGADYIDVNGGISPARELEALSWLINLVQDAVPLPICIDSASPEAIKKGLSLQKNGRAMVNSISMEKGRFEDILPLIKKHDALCVALAMDDSGIPRTADDRLRVVERTVAECDKAGVPLGNVYIDPLVMALSADTTSGLLAMEVVEGIKRRWPGLKTTCGLSNISFGLPKRQLVNRTFLAMMAAKGLDSAIVDPLDLGLMGAIRTSRALRDEDEFCMNYLGAYRQGRLPD